MDEGNDLAKRVGEALKKLRKEKGYGSHVGFANDNEIDQKYYFQVEKGKRNLSLGYLAKVLKAHDLKLGQFFNDLDI